MLCPREATKRFFAARIEDLGESPVEEAKRQADVCPVWPVAPVLGLDDHARIVESPEQ